MSTKKIIQKVKKGYYCSRDHVDRISKTSDSLDLSDQVLITIAVEDFLKKSLAEQNLIIADFYQNRAKNSHDPDSKER